MIGLGFTKGVLHLHTAIDDMGVVYQFWGLSRNLALIIEECLSIMQGVCKIVLDLILV